VENNPGDVEGYNKLAIALEHLGRKQEVVEIWLKYIRQNPGEISNFPNDIPTSLKDRGKLVNEAWDLYVKQYVYNMRGAFKEAECLKALGKHVEALKVMSSHIEQYPYSKSGYRKIYHFAKSDFEEEHKLILAYLELTIAKGIRDPNLLNDIIELQRKTAENITCIIDSIKEYPKNVCQFKNFKLCQYFEILKKIKEQDTWVENLLEDKGSTKIINNIVTWGRDHYFKLAGICKEFNKDSLFYKLDKATLGNVTSFLILEDINIKLLGNNEVIAVDNHEFSV